MESKDVKVFVTGISMSGEANLDDGVAQGLEDACAIIDETLKQLDEEDA